MRVLPVRANRATQRIDLDSHAGERMLRVGLRTQSCAYQSARLLVVAISAMALASCGNISGGRTISVTYSKRVSQPVAPTPSRRQGAMRTRVISQTAPSEPSIEPKAAEPVPLPEVSLLSPQAEPSCEAPGTVTDERQKLDYERQCYRHAEMIVRSRLQLLQEAVARTISAVKRNEWSP
jgi:hypothetical protein